MSLLIFVSFSFQDIFRVILINYYAMTYIGEKERGHCTVGSKRLICCAEVTLPLFSPLIWIQNTKYYDIFMLNGDQKAYLISQAILLILGFQPSDLGRIHSWHIKIIL